MSKSDKKLPLPDSIATQLIYSHFTIALMASIFLNGCATVVKGTSSTVSVESTPANATVIFIDKSKQQKGNSCLTPCEVQLDRQGRYIATVSKAGYDDYTILIRPRLSADGFIGNVSSAALFGAVGFGVDQATGATNDLYPAFLKVIIGDQAAP